LKALADIAGYKYSHAQLGHAHAYLLPTVSHVVASQLMGRLGTRRLFDLGCGNGSVAAYFAERGYEVTGVDPSAEGVAEARTAYPHIRIEQGSAYDDLAAIYGRFPVLISLEVVEHVYAPRDYARTVFDMLESGGIAVVSTPYHGYLKNVAIAISNSFDKHVNPLWDHGHIKFWSFPTLTKLFEEAGFKEISFHLVGRIPQLAKSMIAVARKP
jgi:2-polyprenyl-6-hydroxyphenyl methylase/3-demethylubiquinone-9 3-methyltransferase